MKYTGILLIDRDIGIIAIPVSHRGLTVYVIHNMFTGEKVYLNDDNLVPLALKFRGHSDPGEWLTSRYSSFNKVIPSMFRWLFNDTDWKLCADSYRGEKPDTFFSQFEKMYMVPIKEEEVGIWEHVPWEMGVEER